MVATLVLPHGSSSQGRVLPSRSDTSCPECGANQPVTTPEGFTVCPVCGSEYPDSQPFVCTDPLGHDKGVIQSHMVSRKGGSTMIGTKAERAKCAKVAPNLEWAEKFGQTYEQEVFQRAYFEIRKIFTILEINDRAVLFDAAMTGFVKAYRAVPKGARNRNVHLLALVASYRTLRAAKVPVLLKTYIASCLDHAQFTPRQFLTTLAAKIHELVAMPRFFKNLLSAGVSNSMMGAFSSRFIFLSLSNGIDYLINNCLSLHLPQDPTVHTGQVNVFNK